MAKPWTEEEDKLLMSIIEPRSQLLTPYNWWEAASKLGRKASACRRRYWVLRDREFLDREEPKIE